jgi:hypothetical protein
MGFKNGSCAACVLFAFEPSPPPDKESRSDSRLIAGAENPTMERDVSTENRTIKATIAGTRIIAPLSVLPTPAHYPTQAWI